jgi:MFS family permease
MQDPATGRRAPWRRALELVRPDVPPAVLRLQLGGLLNALGNGLIMPFLIIYLHAVRGIPLATCGLVVATTSGVSLFATPLAGTIVDRVGARRTLFGALGFLAAGFGGYTLVHEAWQGFLAAGVAGIGNGFFWPSQSSLIAGLAGPEHRAPAFAMQRVTMNLGIGLGALIGGFLASTSDPASFQRLFLANALTYLGYMLVLARVPDVPHAVRAVGERAGRYADVLRHRPFMGLIALNFVLITAGISQLDVLPAYVRQHAGMDERGIGWMFLVNTLLVVLLQLPVANALRGRRRMPSLALVALIWAASWALVPLVAARFEGTGATIVFAAVLGIFAIGECFHGSVQAPLVSDLADHRLIGRYMAMSALSWNVGFAAGPAIGGFMLGAAPTALWWLMATVLVGCAGAALLLERAMPVGVRRTPSARPSQRVVTGLDDPMRDRHEGVTDLV